MKKIRHIAHCLLDTLFPRCCAVCGKVLTTDEKFVCTGCELDLPRTNFHRHQFNPVEQLFGGKTPIEHASGYFYYSKGSNYSNILHDIKYHNQPGMGRYFAKKFMAELQSSAYFGDIDCIIPVPLHRYKRIKRGYNQSEYVARGFADILNVPVLTNVIKAKHKHETQTSKGIYERWKNTQGIYEATDTAELEGKHVLLVDDVVTTGATLLSCAMTIADVPGIRISIATLAVSQLN